MQEIINFQYPLIFNYNIFVSSIYYKIKLHFTKKVNNLPKISIVNKQTKKMSAHPNVATNPSISFSKEQWNDLDLNMTQYQEKVMSTNKF